MPTPRKSKASKRKPEEEPVADAKPTTNGEANGNGHASPRANGTKKRKVEAKEKANGHKAKPTQAPIQYTTINGTAWPSDWPAADVDDIDLDLHDLPHASSSTEWWYVNCHLETAKGRKFSAFASFFRLASPLDSTERLHAITWALVDVETETYFPASLVDKQNPKVAKMLLEKGKEKLSDSRLQRALLEVANKGGTMLPDRPFENDPEVSLDSLSLTFDHNTFSKDDKGVYHITCHNPHTGVGFTLAFKPEKKVIRHGHSGVVKIGLKGDDMFYYFIPRCKVTGTVKLGKSSSKVTGTGWYDHEFGGGVKQSTAKPSSESASMEVDTPAPTTDASSDSKEESKGEKKEAVDYAWNWLSVQLDNNVDITSTTVVNPKTNEVMDNYTLLIDADSKRTAYTTSELKPQDFVLSVRTTVETPTRWELHVPEADIHLHAKAAFVDQEFITMITKPSFWEGRMEITGTYQGKPVKGLAFIERHGFHDNGTLDVFFKKVNRLVKNAIEDILPLHPTEQQVVDLVADDEHLHFMDGLDMDVFTKTIIKPLREIVDRGGKSWRSYALLLCMDCVGGNSTAFQHWLAMPEIMHVGSLIVDDIEDESETRRGGPSCHKMYGDPIAINAGTAAYFMAMNVCTKKNKKPIDDETKVAMYENYFLTLRAGHAGQAFDINGLDHLVPAVVESGDNVKLLKSIVCTHRLKSAVPAGNLARMGALLGGGTPEQVKAMGMYFESIGIAFQIIDDVLNLRGFQGAGKTQGEDITAGKITYPVAVALDGKRLNKEQRQQLFTDVQAKHHDLKEVERVIDVIDNCGAIKASTDHAHKLIEDAWNALDPVIPDSFFKLNLRAFGWYVLERHY